MTTRAVATASTSAAIVTILTIALLAVIALLAHTGSPNKDDGRPTHPNAPRRTLDSPPTPKHFTYRVKRKVPHPPSFFTQGFTFRAYDGLLLEGTGLEGQSLVALYDLDEPFKGAPKSPPQRTARVPSNDHFGEGVTEFRGLLYQLTWTNAKVHVWNPTTLAHETELNAPRELAEGWGLTTSPSHDHLLASEGSARVHWFNVRFNEAGTKPVALEAAKSVLVHDCALGKGKDVLVGGLNELETVPLRVTHPDEASALHGDGTVLDYESSKAAREAAASTAGVAGALVWGNVYGTPCVAAFDPVSGRVRAYIHLDGLGPSNSAHERVYNGVAYRAVDDSIWVTGKNWDAMYEIELVGLDEVPGDFPTACRTKWNFPLGVVPRVPYPSSVSSDLCPSSGGARRRRQQQQQQPRR